MALEKLIERIKEEASEEIDDIIKSAEKRAEEIIREEVEKAKREAEKIERNGRKEAERRREKILAGARRKAKIFMIEAKEKLIEECIEEIKRRLASIDAGTYKNVVAKMAEDAIKELDECYMIATRDEDEDVAKQLGVEIKGKRKGLGGIILRSRDGSKEVDLTFDFMLERRKEEIRIKIAEKLFEK